MTGALHETRNEITHPQRPSHRRLLDRVTGLPGTAPVDAVIVPSARPASELGPAVAIADDLNATLVVLCSYAARAPEVRSRWGEHVRAVDVTAPTVLPPLLTTALLARTPFARANDTSPKRNLGLALTRMTGWERILFLDDDIEGVAAAEVMRAASLLDRYQVIGLENTGFPDNSVVCHAYRHVGALQGTFIGGGAMLTRGSRTTSLFPDVYNEDWLFLLDGDTITSCAVHGRFAQRAFDPYKNPVRAGSQEFGDVLGEGIFALLDAGLPLRSADRLFWTQFLGSRAALIQDILRRLPDIEMSQFRRTQIVAALQAARTNLFKITPKLCTDYLAAWRHDRDRWRNWVEALPLNVSVDEGLKHLGF
ncbi:hypothetical protein [Actinoplanes sp. NPDC049265]|uniref:hypothetical protein n=1 Tax=Actinoplanes sp. NPDC049265 TaxID=3363902 RepID=UPI003710E9ED